MSVEIKKVETRKELATFIDFHYDLYAGCPYDVPNLFIDEMTTLRKDKNVAFDFCEAEYYLAYKDGKLAGRVAAIINHRANERWNVKDVRFGWIDFIDDVEVSKALLDAVTEYGRKKGMNSVVGPLGFTDLDLKACSPGALISLAPCLPSTTMLTIPSTWKSWAAGRKTTTTSNIICLFLTRCLRNMGNSPQLWRSDTTCT